MNNKGKSYRKAGLFLLGKIFLPIKKTQRTRKKYLPPFKIWKQICENVILFIVVKVFLKLKVVRLKDRNLLYWVQFSSVQFSCSVVSNSLRPHESQHARPPCPSPTPGVHPNSCPSSQWCHPAISSSVIPFSSCPPIPPSIRVFSNESTLPTRWPKYWSFSFSIIPSKERPGPISFRMDWLDLLAV